MHLRPSSFSEAIYIGLGSNLGDKKKNIQNSIEFLESHDEIRVVKIASFFESPPWGDVAQPSFINSAVEITTALSPFELLTLLKRGEQILGRTKTRRWGPRIIDMDILLFGKRMIDTAELTIPHVELKNRAFVLVPLLEISPHLQHPACNTPLSQFVDCL